MSGVRLDRPRRVARPALVATGGAARGAGMAEDLPLERRWRELRIRRVGEGPSEVQRIIAARDLIGGTSS